MHAYATTLAEPRLRTSMNSSKKNSRRGRKPLLKEAKRRAICAILACGGTRTMAAAFVECSVDTIARTAQRDAEFAAQIRRADVEAMLRKLGLDVEEAPAKRGTIPFCFAVSTTGDSLRRDPLRRLRLAAKRKARRFKS